MPRFSDEKILQIQQKYKEIGIYSKVATICGCSPATVKKYAGAPSKEGSIESKKEKQEIEIARNYILPSIEDISKRIKTNPFYWTSFTIEDSQNSREVGKRYGLL